MSSPQCLRACSVTNWSLDFQTNQCRFVWPSTLRMWHPDVGIALSELLDFWHKLDYFSSWTVSRERNCLNFFRESGSKSCIEYITQKKWQETGGFCSCLKEGLWTLTPLTGGLVWCWWGWWCLPAALVRFSLPVYLGPLPQHWQCGFSKESWIFYISTLI